MEDLAKCYVRLGGYYEGRSAWEKALKAYLKGIEINPLPLHDMTAYLLYNNAGYCCNKLKDYKKGETLEQMEKVIGWTKEVGIRSKGFFMFGNFLETEETLRKTIEFAKRIDLDDFHYTFLTPLPGSEIYNIADKYGSFDNDWAKMSMWNPVFIPKGLNRGILERYSKKAVLSFYLRARIVFSYLKQINTYTGFMKILRMFRTFLDVVFTNPKR